jgi:hypothetical protein
MNWKWSNSVLSVCHVLSIGSFEIKDKHKVFISLSKSLKKIIYIFWNKQKRRKETMHNINLQFITSFAGAYTEHQWGNGSLFEGVEATTKKWFLWRYDPFLFRFSWEKQKKIHEVVAVAGAPYYWIHRCIVAMQRTI